MPRNRVSAAFAFIPTLLGTSRTLSVGPVAVVSLMTATAVGKVAATGSADYASAAVSLAALSGLMLLLMGFLRFGFLVCGDQHSDLRSND